MGRGLLARLFALGPRGWWQLAEAQAAVLRAHAHVRLRPIGTLVTERNRDAATQSDSPPHPPLPHELARVRSLEQGISRVSRLGLTRPLCLARALALVDLLRRHNVEDAVVRVGVRMHDGALRAHAWVEWRGVVLGDRAESVRSYTLIQDLSVLSRGKQFLDSRVA